MRSSLLAAAIALVVFYLRSAPGLTFEDSGEFAAAASNFGVAHPPGYPLLTLLGGLWIQLGQLVGVDPARCMVLLSVLSGAVTVGLLARCIEVIQPANPKSKSKLNGPALVAGLLLVLSPTFAAQAVVVEAYALAAAFQAGLLLAALVAPPLVCGLVFGLALACHPGSLFMAPLFVFGVLRNPNRRAAILRGAAGAAAGLSAYLLIPLASMRAGLRADILNWGNVHDFNGFVDHLLRAQIGTGPPRDIASQAEFAAEHLIGQWPLAIAIAVLFGIQWKKRKSAEGPAKSLVEIALPLFAVTLIVTTAGLFWAHTWPVEQEVARIRLAGSYAPMIVVCAALVGALLCRVEQRLRARPLAFGGLLVLCLLPFPASPYGKPTLADFVDMSEVTEATDYANAVLGAAPEGAILVVNRLGYSDVLFFPLLYSQVTLGMRPDVLVIDREMLSAGWYRDLLAQRRPSLIPALGRLQGQLVAAANSGPRERRIASVPFLRELAASRSLTPHGLGMIGKPSPLISANLPLTAGANGWWLGHAPPFEGEGGQATQTGWTFLDGSAGDPWRRELKKLELERLAK